MNLLHRAGGTLLVRGLSAIGSLLFAALFVRLYSIEAFGSFALALVTIRLLAAGSLCSLDSLLLRILIRRPQDEFVAGRSVALDECIGFAELFSLVAASATFLVAMIGYVVMDGAESFWLSLAILSPAIFLHPVTATRCAIARSRGRVVLAEVVSMGLISAAPLLILTAAWLGGLSPDHLPEVALLTAYVVSALASTALFRPWPGQSLTCALNRVRRGAFRTIRYSLTIHAANMANFLGDWYGALVLSVSASFTATGIMRIFQQVGQAFDLAATSIEYPFAIEVGKAHKRKDRDAVKRLLFYSQICISAVGVVLILFFALAWRYIFDLFKIPDDKFTILAYFLFVSFYLIKLTTGCAASALNMMDTVGYLIRSSIVSVLVAVLLQTALTPFFGITGAAVAGGSVVALRALLNLHFVKKAIREMPPAYNV